MLSCKKIIIQVFKEAAMNMNMKSVLQWVFSLVSFVSSDLIPHF